MKSGREKEGRKKGRKEERKEWFSIVLVADDCLLCFVPLVVGEMKHGSVLVLCSACRYCVPHLARSLLTRRIIVICEATIIV